MNSDATTSTVVTASGTYTIPSYDYDYTFTSDSSCNLDEANGLIDFIMERLKVYLKADKIGNDRIDSIFSKRKTWRKEPERFRRQNVRRAMIDKENEESRHANHQ